MPTVRLDQQLCFSLYSASLAATRSCKPLLDLLGITYPQYLVLLSLWEQDGRGVGAIATRLGLESSTVTPLVKRLEAAGLVVRTRSLVDERQVMVGLTDAGRAIEQKCGIIGETLLARSGITPDMLSALNLQVQALCAALSAPRQG